MIARPPSTGSGVGRGRPPEHSRFKPGQSGNPRGRPKRSKNMATLLDAALSETVIVNENGSRKKLSKRELVVKQAANKAAAGDPRMLLLLMKAFGGSAEADTVTPSSSVLGTDEDEQLL